MVCHEQVRFTKSISELDHGFSFGGIAIRNIKYTNTLSSYMTVSNQHYLSYYTDFQEIFVDL